MDGDSPLRILIWIVICLAFSAFFSASETAFASANRLRVAARAEEGNKNAKRLMALFGESDKVITALVILNDIVNITIATLTTLFATRVWSVDTVGAVTVVTTVVVFLVGESLPKTTALRVSEGLAERIAPLLAFLTKLLTPLIFLFNAASRLLISPFKAEEAPSVTEEELEEMIDTATEAGGIDEDTGELVQSAMDMGRKRAGQILTPWESCIRLSLSAEPEQILSVIRQTAHSRLPVVDKEDRPVGILRTRRYIKAYLESEKKGGAPRLRAVLDRPRFIRSDTPVDELLARLSADKTTVAFVTDRKKNVKGILTVEDVLEELVGEIYDEDDKIGGGGEQNA